jgi:Amidases related to nicotinamidase
MAHQAVLEKDNAALVVVDMQEAFRSAISVFPEIASQIALMVRGCRILNVPILVTEQYPKGLGRTAEEIVLSLPEDFEVFEKTAFSSCGANGFSEKLASLGRRQIILCGIETHICVNQTAHDLLDRGFQVHLLTDCVGSRFEQNKQTAIDKMMQSGVVPSCVEMALFEMMRDARHAQFKQIQNLIK